MNLLLIDGTNVAYRWISKPDNMHSYYAKTVISLAKSFNCDAILVCIDNKGSSFRKSILKEYKAHRRKNKTPEEQEQINHFYKLVEQLPEVLANHEIPAISLKYIETDDIIAYIVKHFHNVLDEIVIVSTDKDLYQLLQYPNVKIYSLIKQEWVYPDTVIERYGVTPEQWVDFKAMIGDASDNIPGIHGIGEKRASQYLNTYGPTYEDILENLPRMKKKLGKIDQNILSGAEIVELNKKLMDLLSHCDEIIPDEYKEVIHQFLESEGVTSE